LRVVTFSSLVVLIAACLVCRREGGCDGNIQRFEVAAGAVPLGFGLIFVLLEAFGLYRLGSWLKIGFGLFMLLWWIAAFVVLTFFGTFKTPLLQNTWYANGFFFTWIALVFSCLMFAEGLKEHSVKSNPPSALIAKSGFLLLIILGSAIEIGAGIRWYYAVGSIALSIYSIVLGAVSIAFVILLFLIMMCTRSDTQDSIYNGMLYLLTLWWAAGAMILTFQNYWNEAVDNGFFSVYFTTGACLLALSGIWRHDDHDRDMNRENTIRENTIRENTY
jgi:hypothetical protein